MARIHARRKGKSGSTRPAQVDLSNMTIKPKEIESIVLKLAKDDVKPSKIGIVLRDTYAVPNVKAATKKSISQILNDDGMGLQIPEDLSALIQKAQRLTKHLENNSRDTHNRRGLALVEAKIRRLAKYYVRTSKLPKGWKYKN